MSNTEPAWYRLSNLPPLPIGWRFDGFDWFTADQMRAYGKACAAAEREACAELAQQTICDVHLPTGVRIYGTKAAAAIRARG